jgi:hypothetical protein
MKYIVKHAEEFGEYTFELYDDSKVAWARYKELLEQDVERLSFISPGSEEDYQKALRGEAL